MPGWLRSARRKASGSPSTASSGRRTRSTPTGSSGWPGGQGVQDGVVEALFRAYFTEGRDISNRQTLLGVVAEAGLDRHEAEAVLNRGDSLGAVRDADALARRFGVDGVPFFIVNGTLTLSGAQQPGTFLEAFRQADGSKG